MVELKMENHNETCIAPTASCSQLESEYLDSCQRHHTPPIDTVLQQIREALFDMITYYMSVTTVSIGGDWHLNFQAVSNIITKSCQLDGLEVVNRPLGPGHAPVLARALRDHSCRLRVLCLQRARISGEPLLCIVTALKTNNSVVELRLGDNCLTESDAAQLSSLLRYNSRLQHLDLTNNQIQDVGAGHIALALLVQVRMQVQVQVQVRGTLNVSRASPLQSSSGDAESRGLSVLVLSNNQLTNNCLQHLSRALRSSRTLCELNIDGNALSVEAVRLLQEAGPLVWLGSPPHPLDGLTRSDDRPQCAPIFVPEAARPLTPVSVRPLTPVSARPLTPVSARPLAPVSAQPLTPVTARPLTPVSARPLMPVSARPLTLVSARPLTPVSARPLTPVSARPLKPVSARPLTPVSARPVKPVSARKLLARRRSSRLQQNQRARRKRSTRATFNNSRKRKNRSSEESEDETECESIEESEVDEEMPEAPTNGSDRKQSHSNQFPDVPKHFQSGNFVLIKSDIKWQGDIVTSKLDDFNVWKIVGKALMNKYIPVESAGRIIHKCTCVYTGWKVDNRDSYYSITDILDQNPQTDLNDECVALDLNDLIKVRDK